MAATLYAAVLEVHNYIVGAANAPSGLHRLDDSGWTHLGWKNTRCFGVACDSARSDVLFLACGNGVLRSRDGGATWRVTTDWRITEVLSVALDGETVYAATAYGVWRSLDGGDTWITSSHGIPDPTATFTQTIALDRAKPQRLLVGSEEGLFVSTDGAASWQPVGPRVPIRALRQHPTEHAVWLAGTEDHGILHSHDGGATWKTGAGDLSAATIYTVALDPADSQHLAAAGYRTGLFSSTDGGATWTPQPLELPVHSLHALAFDPNVSGRLWLGTVGAGVFSTDDGGATCVDAGLPEATIYELLFV